MSTLPAGTRLGPYEIVECVGVGGMGEVYRAHDSRLGRWVAIKTLPRRVSDDPALRKRFAREARAISALSHPRICALYDIGEDGGQEFLVMEYLEGESLARCLSRGPLPRAEAIRIAAEIAEALDHAHKRGVVHRDLKPGNVMLTASGVKLLDFGLARLTQGSEVSALTADNPLIGTVEYMAPEQLNGEDADARTDLFAFGVLLYEMVSGQRPFRGETPASVIGAILFSEPEPLYADAPADPLERLIATCLRKKPDDRFQSAHDINLQLQWIAEGAAAPEPGWNRRKRRLGRAVVVVTLVTTLIVVGAAAAAFVLRNWLPRRTTEVRFTIESPVKGESLDWPVISPDGRKIVFESRSAGGESSLWIRDLSSTAPRRLVAHGTMPFWSPRGDAVAFFGGDKLQLIRIGETEAQAIAAATAPRGGSWGATGTLLYTPDIGAGIWCTDSRGSSSRAVTQLNRARGDVTHRWPEFLPDGEHFLFVIQSRVLQRSGLYAGSLRDGVIKKVSAQQGRTVVSADGWMYFTKERKLWRQRFDLSAMEVRGDPALFAGPIEPDLRTTGATRISVSANGDVVYSSPIDRRSSVDWVDRDGRTLRTVLPPGHYIDPSLSPDERTLAISRVDEETGINSIWLADTATGAMTALVDEEANAIGPIWRADGKRILYASDRRGSYDIYERFVASVASDRLIFDAATYARPLAVSTTGVLIENSKGGGATSDFLFWPEGAPSPKVLFTLGGGGADLTRDGRWIALRGVHELNTRASLEVRALADTERRLRVGPEESAQPTWSPDGDELYYVVPSGRVVVAPFHDGSFGPAVQLFPVSLYVGFTSRSFVPTAGGNRFLVVRPVTTTSSTSATVVIQQRN